MKTFVRIFFFLLLIALHSCEDTGLLVKCDDCFPAEPLQTVLEIKLEDDPSFFTPGIRISIFEGNIEDSSLVARFRTFGTSTSYDVVLNKKYSVSASYLAHSGAEYIAIDSATPSVKYEKSQCDEKCYYVYDKVIDLRLKYTR